jgi:hypothetical protein
LYRVNIYAFYSMESALNDFIEEIKKCKNARDQTKHDIDVVCSDVGQSAELLHNAIRDYIKQGKIEHIMSILMVNHSNIYLMSLEDQNVQDTIIKVFNITFLFIQQLKMMLPEKAMDENNQTIYIQKSVFTSDNSVKFKGEYDKALITLSSVYHCDNLYVNRCVPKQLEKFNMLFHTEKMNISSPDTMTACVYALLAHIQNCNHLQFIMSFLKLIILCIL